LAALLGKSIRMCLFTSVANNAAPYSNAPIFCGTERSFAAITVNPPGGEHQDGIMRRDDALSAISNSLSTAMPEIKPAPVYVLHSCGSGIKAPVYNLTVATEHEYFANGILVSNCDALRYMIVWLTGAGDGEEQRLVFAPEVVTSRY
jgi:hypothetical protein